MKRRIKDMYKICVYHASYPHGNYTLQYAVGPFIQIPFANISSYFHSNLIFFLDTVYNSVISNFFVRDHIRNTCICHDFWLIGWKGFCASTDETCHVILSRWVHEQKFTWNLRCIIRHDKLQTCLTALRNIFFLIIFRLCFICSCYVDRHIWWFPGWYNDVDILFAR